MKKMYKNNDTGEIFTLEEIKTLCDQFYYEAGHESAKDYFEFLLNNEEIKELDNNIECFTLEEIKVKIDNEIMDAILIHEKSDIFHNNDRILFDVNINDIENDEEIVDLLKNEYTESDFQIVNGIYIV